MAVHADLRRIDSLPVRLAKSAQETLKTASGAATTLIAIKNIAKIAQYAGVAGEGLTKAIKTIGYNISWGGGLVTYHFFSEACKAEKSGEKASNAFKTFQYGWGFCNFLGREIGVKFFTGAIFEKFGGITATCAGFSANVLDGYKAGNDYIEQSEKYDRVSNRPIDEENRVEVKVKELAKIKCKDKLFEISCKVVKIVAKFLLGIGAIGCIVTGAAIVSPVIVLALGSIAVSAELVGTIYKNASYDQLDIKAAKEALAKDRLSRVNPFVGAFVGTEEEIIVKKHNVLVRLEPNGDPLPHQD